MLRRCTDSNLLQEERQLFQEGGCSLFVSRLPALLSQSESRFRKYALYSALQLYCFGKKEQIEHVLYLLKLWFKKACFLGVYNFF